MSEGEKVGGGRREAGGESERGSESRWERKRRKAKESVKVKRGRWRAERAGQGSRRRRGICEGGRDDGVMEC